MRQFAKYVSILWGILRFEQKITKKKSILSEIKVSVKKLIFSVYFEVKEKSNENVFEYKNSPQTAKIDK